MKLLAIKQDPTPRTDYRLFIHGLAYEIDCYVNGQFASVYTISINRSQIIQDFLNVTLGGRNGSKVEPI